jgi:DNA-binding PadR family transcriptional regulator
MNTYSILKALKITGQTTDVLLGILIGGGNLKTMRRKAFYPTMPEFTQKTKYPAPPQKENLYKLLYQLKKQGFIKKEGDGKNGRWIITALGKQRFEKLKNMVRMPKINYQKEKDEGLNIIIFDIPEKYRKKRDWLRRCLSALEFTMLQKSVWTGKNKLPEEFLKDLEELNLIDFIHIFKVSKTGTLKINKN